MALIAPHLPKPSATGRPREIINGIFCVTRAGCSWRLLPNDFAAIEDDLPLVRVQNAYRSDVRRPFEFGFTL
uniref:Transposase n=1 Tax=Bradyrhizobium quebecense TaxID=2748629 RepID=A0A973WR64_9BRAD